MTTKKGSAHALLLVLIVVGFWVVVLYVLVSRNIIKLPGGIKLPGLNQAPKVSLKEEYKNPFKKESQYVNPFKEYKNPFNNL